MSTTECKDCQALLAALKALVKEIYPLTSKEVVEAVRLIKEMENRP